MQLQMRHQFKMSISMSALSLRYTSIAVNLHFQHVSWGLQSGTAFAQSPDGLTQDKVALIADNIANVLGIKPGDGVPPINRL